jgi:hypothetical protein
MGRGRRVFRLRNWPREAIVSKPDARTIRYALALAVVGCVSSDILRLETAPRPETSPGEVRLLAEEPTEPYTVIALITVSRSSPYFHSVGSLRDRLRREAARLGGQAVLFDAASLSRTDGATRLSAKVIVFERAPS